MIFDNIYNILHLFLLIFCRYLIFVFIVVPNVNIIFKNEIYYILIL